MRQEAGAAWEQSRTSPWTTLAQLLCNPRDLGGNPGSSILAFFLWPAPLPPSSEDSELSLTTVCWLCPSWHFHGLM